MKTYTIQNYTALLGQNKHDNWYILNSNLEYNYLFFHLSRFPSGYVILQTEDDVDEDIKKECAQICLKGSKYRNYKRVKVDCTRLNNVKKGEEIGEIEYKSNRKIEIIIIKYK